ncbi:hypothetical protein [Mycobacteroides abscessus]|uniref:hypothetical protein n=1 Tax=Mycobacteroides abscessus TaxID=36809 RepID=UPI0012FFFD07|nr:hypothetical protein [Mycobacteroides abscessus]
MAAIHIEGVESPRTREAVANALRHNASVKSILDKLGQTQTDRYKAERQLRRLSKVLPKADCTQDETNSALSELRAAREEEFNARVRQRLISNATEIKQNLQKMRGLRDKRNKRATILNHINRQLRTEHHSHLAPPHTELLNKHHEIIADLRETYMEMLALIELISAANISQTATSDIGLISADYSIQQVIALGGTTRSKSTIYQRLKNERAEISLVRLGQAEQDLVELLQGLALSEPVSQELRDYIERDLHLLGREPGHTSLPD